MMSPSPGARPILFVVLKFFGIPLPLALPFHTTCLSILCRGDNVGWACRVTLYRGTIVLPIRKNPGRRGVT